MSFASPPSGAPLVRVLTALALGSLLALPGAAQHARSSTASPQADGRHAARTPPGLPLITTAPVLEPNPRAPLTATIRLRTSVPTRVSLEVEDGSRTFLVPRASRGFRTDHAVPVLGLRPGRAHRIWVIATDRTGRRAVARKPVSLTTPPLPADFPPISFQTLDPTRMEPGFTLLTARASASGARYSVALDSAGQVVWYLDGFRYASRTSRGTLLVETSRTTRFEVDMLGNLLHEWVATGLGGGSGTPTSGKTEVATDTFHHEFREVDNESGEYLTLSSEIRTYPNYPASEAMPWQKVPSADVVGDVIVEFRSDGTIVREKRLLDILDPYRIGYDSLTLTFWHQTYGPTALDWSHANSVVVTPEGDAYIVSVRHQDAIVKIRRNTPGTGSPNDLVWILGSPDAWVGPWAERVLRPARSFSLPLLPGIGGTPDPLAFEWPYHQHAAVFTESGNLVCFDNGNHRATPPAPPMAPINSYSRAVEYRIEPELGSIQQVWAAGGKFDPVPRRLGYATFVSNAEPLPRTGNVLVNAGGSVDFTTGTTYIHVFELRRTQPAKSVMEMTIRDPAGQESWSAYRAHRIPNLYPPRSIQKLELAAGRVVAERRLVLELQGGALAPGDVVSFSLRRTGPAGEPSASAALLGRAVVGADGIARLDAPGPSGASVGELVELSARVVPSGRARTVSEPVAIFAEVQPAGAGGVASQSRGELVAGPRGPS